MMDQNEHLKELAHIRGLMDRSTRFLSLSGLSGVFAGCVALVGAVLARYHINETLGPARDVLTYGTGGSYTAANALLITLITDAALVLLVALLGAGWFTWRRSRKAGQYLWDASARRLMWNMLIPLAVGGIFCLALFHYGLPGLVPPATLIFYGLALINASKFTLDEIRWLGFCELALGLVALFWLEAGLLFWALGFGVLHIVYGALMYLRYEREVPAERA
ncbi:MAG: hypothetical protein IPH05_16235 [Flavobacteriales bacterium]|nr:hypothetical protein [Flavobacteriales bacterium]MBK6548951.1 hypothetical protein [Flavobacteriales bacterium]MBK6884457.1 hypothetical protein [Flavobacteriales bacterium]MBK7100852.1 hypothetical protein [Flavobacteriales bacterium]MBK7111539.1 hypothetical protein [Flavobacteriales bacterium]